MTRSDINDLYMRAEAFGGASYDHLQVLDATGSKTAALTVELKRVKFGAAGTATLKAAIQRSNDLGNWFPEGTPVTFTVIATGAADMPGESKALADFAVKGFRWLRVEYELATTGAVVEALLSAQLNAVLEGD